MATLEQDHTLAVSATFVSKVEAAVFRRLNSLFAAGTLTGDSGNLATARAILYDPASHAALIARSVVTEAAVAARNGVEANVTDAEISAAVNTVLSRYVR
jgi:hypothetical protein